ncbi:MAG: response regulator [Saprospiraceae bacterium]|nr:response regulator [Saprospiraceae bacterium]
MTKVLLIDDNAAILTFMAARLKSENVETLTADNGADGLRIAREHYPDVVVLDLMMPKMHGYTLIQEIRNDTNLSKVKILVISAKTYTADLERTIRLGADRYLSKPFDLQVFWKTIADPSGRNQITFLTFRFWGVRGSIATPGPDTVKYGGNTACTEVRCGEQLLILDAGTGIRQLGLSLLHEFKQKPINAHIFCRAHSLGSYSGIPFCTSFHPREMNLQFTACTVRKNHSKSIQGTDG